TYDLGERLGFSGRPGGRYDLDGRQVEPGANFFGMPERTTGLHRLVEIHGGERNSIPFALQIPLSESAAGGINPGEAPSSFYRSEESLKIMKSWNEKAASLTREEKNPVFGKTWFWILLVLFLLFIAAKRIGGRG